MVSRWGTRVSSFGKSGGTSAAVSRCMVSSWAGAGVGWEASGGFEAVVNDCRKSFFIRRIYLEKAQTLKIHKLTLGIVLKV